MRSHHALPVLRAVLVASLLPALSRAGDQSQEPAEPQCSIAQWWNGEGMTGNWFGLRPGLADRGLTFSGKYYGAFFGVVDSEQGSRGFWDQGIQFGADQNFGKLLDLEALKGVKAFGQFRYRSSEQSADPNQFVRGNSMFNPSNWISGTQFRVLSFGLEISSADFLPVENMIVLRGGWLQPQSEFLDQPLSKLFLNNAVNSAKGVGGDIPFSSSFSTWGGTLRLEPVKNYYAKAGLFMAYPNATSSSNHGLAYAGFAPDPSQNGLLAMAETGITPSIGRSRLPGKYAAGGYYFGGRRDSFNGTYNYGQFGFYFQADQMLYRESSAAPTPLAKGPADGGKTSALKDFKQPVSVEAPALSPQGLSMFNVVTFAPKYNNPFPFYFHTGLVYTGLIPRRDADLTMFSVAYGSYSFYNIQQLQAEGNPNQPNYTIFLEGGYRVAINKWAFVQPFIQYEIRPSGAGDVRNATILGFYTGVNF